MLVPDKICAVLRVDKLFETGPSFQHTMYWVDVPGRKSAGCISGGVKHEAHGQQGRSPSPVSQSLSVDTHAIERRLLLPGSTAGEFQPPTEPEHDPPGAEVPQSATLSAPFLQLGNETNTHGFPGRPPGEVGGANSKSKSKKLLSHYVLPCECSNCFRCNKRQCECTCKIELWEREHEDAQITGAVCRCPKCKYASIVKKATKSEPIRDQIYRAARAISAEGSDAAGYPRIEGSPPKVPSSNTAARQRPNTQSIAAVGKPPKDSKSSGKKAARQRRNI